MGSLIQTLAEQAKSSIPEGTLSVFEWIESYNKKFAELIVRECARVYWNIDDGEIHGEYVKALKEHFGIEK